MQRSFESYVRSIQSEAGWSDTTLLGILLDFLTFFCTNALQRKTLAYLERCKKRTLSSVDKGSM